MIDSEEYNQNLNEYYIKSNTINIQKEEIMRNLEYLINMMIILIFILEILNY